MILNFKEEIKKMLEFSLLEKGFTLMKGKVFLEESKHPKYGFFNTNLPYIFSSIYKKSLEEAEKALSFIIPKHKYISDAKFEKGYINFFISSELIKDFYISSLEKEKIIFYTKKKGKKYFIEIVSANPTGTLHIGHIRNGVITDTLSNLLEYNGDSVFRSYLVNDSGAQIKELISSIHQIHSYLSKASPIDLKLQTIKYSDEKVRDCAKTIGEKFGHYWELNNKDLTREIKKYSIEYFINLIKKELKELSIQVDSWDYESKICSEGALSGLISKIKDFVYLEGKALWFKTKEFNPEYGKDDVIVKGNGELSYFGQDLIYHLYKLEFLGSNGIIVNTLAEDHKGHIQRMHAFFKSIGIPDNIIRYRTTKLSRLLIEGKKVVFSKRDNIFLSLEELKEHLSIEEIRWLLNSRDEEGELDIEIQKLKNKDYNNPIFYILYAYSRASRLAEKMKLEISASELSFEELNSERELELIHSILSLHLKFQKAVEFLKPSILSGYLYSFAQKFHSFYDNFSIANDFNIKTKLARLSLVQLSLRIFSEILPIFRINPKNLN